MTTWFAHTPTRPGYWISGDPLGGSVVPPAPEPTGGGVMIAPPGHANRMRRRRRFGALLAATRIVPR